MYELDFRHVLRNKQNSALEGVLKIYKHVKEEIAWKTRMACYLRDCAPDYHSTFQFNVIVVFSLLLDVELSRNGRLVNM